MSAIGVLDETGEHVDSESADARTADLLAVAEGRTTLRITACKRANRVRIRVTRRAAWRAMAINNTSVRSTIAS